MIKNLSKLAREIVESNQYMTIGTSDGKDNIWVNAVSYAYDNKNLYFVSFINSKHSINIKKKENVVVAIFDSHQKWGEGIGLQIEGKVKEISLKEIPHTMLIFFKRKYPFGRITVDFGKGLKKLLSDRTYRFYKFTPTTTWMNNPNSDIDERVKVYLTK